ncbi:MAG TPA: rhodanese-like domain-containing protein [Actinomycetota bacterium]
MNDVRQLYEDRDRYQILDVREPFEWDAGHIENAIHVPLADVMQGSGADRLDPERPIVVVCKVGSRSELASLMLQARGFDAQNLEGGTEAWVAAGLPIVDSAGAPGKVA